MMGIKLHPGDHFTDLCTIQEEGNDESSRVAFPIIEQMETEARGSSRRSSDSDSLNSSYKVSQLSYTLSLVNCENPGLATDQETRARDPIRVGIRFWPGGGLEGFLHIEDEVNFRKRTWIGFD